MDHTIDVHDDLLNSDECDAEMTRLLTKLAHGLRAKHMDLTMRERAWLLPYLVAWAQAQQTPTWQTLRARYGTVMTFTRACFGLRDADLHDDPEHAALFCALLGDLDACPPLPASELTLWLRQLGQAAIHADNVRAHSTGEETLC